MVDLRPQVATDAFLGGSLQLRQPVMGQRAGTDAVLLAAAAPDDATGLALDVGAGVGAAGLALAKRRPQLHIGLVENNADAAALARDNLRLNDVGARGHVYEVDVLDAGRRIDAGLLDGSAQLVITNPPFLDPLRSRVSPQPSKRTAHAMVAGGAAPLTAWICACLDLLADAGVFIMIHRPDALADILAAISPRVGGLTLLPVLAHADKPATRILLRGKKGSRTPLVISPALVLHAGHAFTPEAEAIHRGGARIAW